VVVNRRKIRKGIEWLDLTLDLGLGGDRESRCKWEGMTWGMESLFLQSSDGFRELNGSLSSFCEPGMIDSGVAGNMSRKTCPCCS
jgi:hypothetical protein